MFFCVLRFCCCRFLNILSSAGKGSLNKTQSRLFNIVLKCYTCYDVGIVGLKKKQAFKSFCTVVLAFLMLKYSLITR